MPEYIEREAAYEAINKDVFMTESEQAYFRNVLNRVPTADVAPAIRGRWEIYREPEWPEWAMRLMCSACGLKTSQKSNYCPNCGARMDLKEGENNND